MPKLHELDLNDYQAFVSEYHGESDRAAAVMAASFLENYLGIYLRHFMAPDSGAEQLLERGPLASFDARIKIAYAFRLISSEQRDDLLAIKLARNEFAHDPGKTSFASPRVLKQIEELSLWRFFKDSANDQSTAVKDPKSLYLYTIGMFVGFAHNQMIKPAPAP